MKTSSLKCKDQTFFFGFVGPSIYASYQVSVHMVEGFQRRRLKYEKLPDNRCQMMAKAHIAFGKAS
jgi:hypothetical protein